MIPSCKKIYLCNPAFNIITLLNGLVTSSVSYSIHSKDYQTLSFEVDRFININGKQVESSGYDDLKVFMYVYLEDIGYFQIQQPEITSDGMREYKTITAYSCEKEFEDKDVGIFKVNTGEDGSYERLNEDNIDELGYAKNYVTFYRSNSSGLTDYSLLHLILEYFPNWTVDDDDVDESLWYKKATFDEENINGYALLTSTIAPKFECIITFDIIHRKIGAIAKEHLESSSVQVELPDGTTKTVTYNNDFDTSIFVGFRNLANQISISTDEDSVYTQFTCEGNDDLTFEDVNFGQSTIIDLSYFACEPYMSDETAQKILNWKTWCDENRDTYMSLAKQWADIDDKKTEIEDRVPSDMDYYDQWEEMDSDLLDKNLKYYQTLLQSLQISVDPRPDNEKYTGTGDDKTYNPVKKSDGTTDDDYYMDLLKQQANGYGGYYTYLEIITYVIPNINVAIYNKGKTEANQESYITSYETNWDLYGITELQNKKTTYETVISTLADYKLPYSESGSTTDEDTYNTKYSEYWNAKKHLEELEPYLEALLKEQEELQTQLDEIQSKKLELQHGYQFSYTYDDGNTVYNYDLTEEEVQLINTLIHNTDYTNSNIISTSVDTTVTLIDREKELFDDSVDKLSEVSQPQFNFSVELDNLLRIEEFSGWVEDCSLYRFIRLGFRDNYSIKVRIIGIEYNPCEITPDLTLEFSNMITSRSGRSDLTDILDSENNRGSKNSISLGASTDYDTEFATTLLQTMINTNLFQRSVSNIVGNIEVTGTAVIDEAQIKNLFTEYVEAGEIKVGYISGTQAEFEKFYAQYGLFDSLVAQAIKATEITTDQIRGTNGETFIDLVNSAINVDSIITDVITGKNSDNEYYIDMVTGALNMDKLMSNIITGTDTDSKYYINMLTGALNMDTIVTNLITGQGENSKYYIDMVSGALNLDTVIANLITGTDTDKQYYINMLTGALNMDTIATNLITGKDGNDTYYIDMITGALNMDTISANMAEFGYLTAKSADLAYAKIDFANVADGIIDTALIKDGAIIDAKISSVSANKLTAGTIDASKINVTNLNADNINVGTINGKLIGNASVDLDKLSEEVPTKEYLDSVQNDLQNQIDGAIETFTIDTVPTLTNEPAVNWSDNATKAKHVGDICYVLNENLDENGYCYRFANTGTATSPVYEWVLIKDSDVTKVLQDLVDMQGDISGLKTFETETTKWKSDTDASIESIISNVTKVETDLGAKVDKTTFNEVKQTVDSNSASITALSNTVDTKIDSLSKTVNEVKQTADTNSSTISSLSKTVETKADGSTVEAIETRTSALEQNLEGFQSTVSNTYVTQTTYNNKVSDLETDISDAQNTATTASTNASNAVATANQASTDASSALSKATDLEERADNGEFKGEKGDKGDTGTSITIKSTKIEYQVSSSGTDTPTGAWQTTIPSTSEGQYLWSRTTVTYSDNTSTVSYSISRNGSNGSNGKDGTNGTSPTVVSTTTEYVQSTSGVKTPTSGWDTTPPTAIAGQYIWTKNTITYSDGQTAISYSVVKNGVDGEQGEQGVSVVSQKNQYYLSTSNTSTVGGDWSDTPPTLTDSTYIWTRLCYTLSDGSIKYSTEVLDNSLNEVVTRIIKAETSISQNKEDITLKATKTEVATAKSEAISTASDDATKKADSALSEAKTYADAQIKISADEISSTVKDVSDDVSTLQQKADYVLTAVSGSDGTSSFKISSTAMESITDQFIVKSPDGTSTIISGGTLAVYSITADMLNASAIKSQNYVEGTYTGDAGYSMSGTFLDLSNGLVHMPGLYNDISGNTYFRGSITATGGLIGIDSDNSWEIGSVTILERNGTEKEYASLASTGNAIISTGKLQLHDDKLNTFNSGNYLSYDGTFYDYGIQIPELDPNKYDSGNTEKTAGAFLYVRKYTPPSGYTTPPQYDSEWTYLFRVTKDGSIYFGDTLVSGADGAFLSKSGGTITGDLNINGDLTVGGTITGNLNGSITGQAASVAHSISVNGKSFNGSADCNVGTLGVSYGGTGKISWSQYGLLYASTSNVLSQLDVGTSGQILQSNGNATPTWVDQSDLSVSTATKLATPRTITFLGDTTGELSFDGSEDVSVEMVRRSCYVGQTSYNSSKPYFKFASIETDKESSKYAITFRVTMRSGQVDATAGILTATFDTSSTGTYSSSMFFWEYALRGISTSNFYLAYNSNVSPAVVELWVNCSSFSNNGYYFTVLSETLNGENITNAWTLYNNYGNGESKMTSEYSNETSYMSTSKNSTQGNASSATVLSTARTLTIGSTGKTFNGSSNVSWTLDEIGAASSDHTHAFITDITLNSINKSATDSAHVVTFTRDELLSAVGVGTTSESSPIAAGLITMAERNKLASITVSDIGTVGANSIKGNAPITVSISNGVATISHNTSGITAGTYKSVTVNAYGHITSGTNPTTLSGYGITDALSSTTKYAGSSSVGGSATSAVKLETARTISLSGGATGTATSFNGTANITIPVTELDATLLSGTATIDTTGNASTATLADKAKQDANGNTIDTYYCSLSTEQTLSGKKTFSNVVNISNTTASTSMTSGALTVSGGIGVSGSVSANIVRVNDNVSLEYNNNTESLDFVFA